MKKGYVKCQINIIITGKWLNYCSACSLFCTQICFFCNVLPFCIRQNIFMRMVDIFQIINEWAKFDTRGWGLSFPLTTVFHFLFPSPFHALFKYITVASKTFRPLTWGWSHSFPLTTVFHFLFPSQFYALLKYITVASNTFRVPHLVQFASKTTHLTA